MHCSHIKVRNLRRFTKCPTCDGLTAAIKTDLSNASYKIRPRLRRTNHLEFVCKKRLEYYKQRVRASLFSEQHCSIIVDGTDRSAFGLPRFKTSTKSQREKAMNVKLIGILKPKNNNNLYLFTMTEEHETAVSHNDDAAHRFLNHRASSSPLPPRLYIQADTCCKKRIDIFSHIWSVRWPGKCSEKLRSNFFPLGIRTKI